GTACPRPGVGEALRPPQSPRPRRPRADPAQTPAGLGRARLSSPRCCWLLLESRVGWWRYAWVALPLTLYLRVRRGLRCSLWWRLDNVQEKPVQTVDNPCGYRLHCRWSLIRYPYVDQCRGSRAVPFRGAV